MYNVYLVNMSGEDGHNTSYKVEIIQKMFIHQLECECIVIVHCLCGSQLLVEGGGGEYKGSPHLHWTKNG